MDLDNELVNLDGTLDSKMKEKKKLQVISKKPKDNKVKNLMQKKRSQK